MQTENLSAMRTTRTEVETVLRVCLAFSLNTFNYSEEEGQKANGNQNHYPFTLDVRVSAGKWWQTRGRFLKGTHGA